MTDYVKKALGLVERIEQVKAGDEDYALGKYLLAGLYLLIGIVQELNVISGWLRELYELNR